MEKSEDDMGLEILTETHVLNFSEASVLYVQISSLKRRSICNSTVNFLLLNS